MSDVLFKASLQNTLNPEVGTFTNVDNKKGTFTLEDGEYYLTNNTSTSYRVYYPTKDITYSVGFTTIEFDVNYNHSYSSLIHPCLLFNGDDNKSWYAFGSADSTLYFEDGPGFPNHEIVTSPSTWLHVKCIFDYNPDQSIVHIYIDNVEVNNFTISKNYDIKTIDILGNNDSLIPLIPDTKIKNITIYHSKKHYLDTPGLTLLWSKIKSLFATKTELASKANDSDVVHKSGNETIAGTKTFSKPIAGSVTGNAASATKLQTARTINGIAFDGTADITIPVTELASSAIRAQWYAAFPDGAEAHNAMWGGRDITAAFDSGEFSRNVEDGTFKDIFPGDYITKQVTISGTTYDVNWIVADCDYWIHKGDSVMANHHVVIVPQTPIFTAQMNSDNTTEGGYKGSRMYKETIPAFATGIVNAFGSSHILTFRDNIISSVDTSYVSSGFPQFMGTPNWWGEWVDARCNLMSEKMVYGAPICSGGAMNNTMATRQMSAFRLSEKAINYNGGEWWLRDVVTSEKFAIMYGSGDASAMGASYELGVRPFALLC